jgi:hypothetical protein
VIDSVTMSAPVDRVACDPAVASYGARTARALLAVDPGGASLRVGLLGNGAPYVEHFWKAFSRYGDLASNSPGRRSGRR